MPGALAAARAQYAADAKSSSGGGGDGGFFGIHLPHLGLGEVAGSIGGAVGGIGRALGALAPGGTPAGAPWSAIGRGALGGLYATESRLGKLIPGDPLDFKGTDKQWANYVAVKTPGTDAQKQHVFDETLASQQWSAYKHHFLPTLINDAGSLSIAGGAAGKIAGLGEVGAAAKASIAGEAAAKAGYTAEEAAKAAEIAKSASPIARATQNIPIVRRFTAGDLASVPKALRESAAASLRADGSALSDAAIAKRVDLLTKLEHTAHPYQAAFGAVRNLGRAAETANIAAAGERVAPELDAAAAAGEVPTLPESTAPIGPKQRALDYAKAQPVPTWATKAVDKAPQGVRDVLAGIEGKATARGLKGVSREQARLVEMQRRATLEGPAMTEARGLAESMVGHELADGTKITPEMANRMVAEEIANRLSGKRQIGEAMKASMPEELHASIDQHFTPGGLPAELRTAETSAAIDRATAQFHDLAGARRDILMGSRKGDTGLGNIATDSVELTAKQQRTVKQLQRQAAELLRMGPRKAAELDRVRTQLDGMLTKATRAADEHGRIMQLLEQNRLAAAKDLNPYSIEMGPADASKVAIGDRSIADLARELKQRKGESPAQLKARAYRVGRAAEREIALQQRAARLMRSGTAIDKAQSDLFRVLTEEATPTGKAMNAARARLARESGKLTGALDHPTIAQVPGRWKPLWGAFDEFGKAARANPQMAEALAGVPDTFNAVVARAKELGVDPEHIASLSEDQVRRLVADPVKLGKSGREFQVIESGTRKVRRGAEARTQTLEALAAAQVDVVHEAASNEVVTYIEKNIARPVLHDDVGNAIIPKGWTEWDATRNFLVNGKETPAGDTVVAAGQGQPTMMIPRAVHTTIRNMTGDFNHSAFRAVGKITKPWSALVLTWTPRWYVNNVMGNTVLATAQGVRLDDWIAALVSHRVGKETKFDNAVRWLAERKGTYNAADVAPEGTAGIGGSSIYSDLQGAPAVVHGPHKVRGQAKLAREAGEGRLGVAKAGYNEAARKMQRANEVVDDMARTAMYLSRRRGGVSPEAAVQAAVQNLVDYNDLSPFERQAVRSVVPFYAWQKGVFKIVAKLPIEHPAGAAFTMQLANLNEELNGPMPQWYQDMVHLPGTNLNINTRSFNPFADAASLATPQGIAQGINPFVEIAARNALGAPQNGYAKHFRINEFGKAVPDTSPAEDLTGIFTGLPQAGPIAATTGLGANDNTPSAARGLGKFFGASTYTPEQLAAFKSKMADAQQVVDTGNPYAKVKSAAGSTYHGAGARFINAAKASKGKHKKRKKKYHGPGAKFVKG